MTQFCEHCEVCQAASSHRAKINRGEILADFVNQKVDIDLIGPIKAEGSEERYVMMMVDVFSRYATAELLTNKKATTTAAAALRWIHAFGAPQTIHPDQGREFLGEFALKLERHPDHYARVPAPEHRHH